MRSWVSNLLATSSRSCRIYDQARS
jgi:hypothetical protein